MKINKILPTPSLNKIWSEFNNVMSELSQITNKLITLEELVMSNAGLSDIYENARNRIVNSALGKALGLTNDTQILDAAIAVEGVADNGALNTTIIPSFSKTKSFNIAKGYHNGNGKVTVDKINLQSQTVSCTITIAKQSGGSGKWTFDQLPEVHGISAIAHSGEGAIGLNGGWTIAGNVISCGAINMSTSGTRTAVYTITAFYINEE